MNEKDKLTDGDRYKFSKVSECSLEWLTEEPSNSFRLPAGRDIGLSIRDDAVIIMPVKVRIDTAPKKLLPPAFGEALLVLFCPKKRIDAMMGDLEEQFHEHVETKGERRAKLLYWSGVLRSIGPQLWVKVRKAGLIALLVEISRRWGGLS
jgi:hypothetical protein